MKLFKRILSIVLSLSIAFSSYSIPARANSNEFTINKAIRISGSDRFETSIATTRKSKKKNVVLANGLNFPDALSAVNIVNTMDADLLLLSNDNYMPVLNKISEKKYETIYIVGGTSAVGSHIENILKKANNTVVRLGGLNRYDTNRKTLELAGYRDVAVVSGENFPDALSSARFLQENKLGLYLIGKVDGEKLGTSPLNYFNAKYIIGGENAVSYKGNNIERIAGADRYKTAEALAKRTSVRNLIIVNAFSFQDGLSAINLTDLTKSDIILARQDNDKHNGIEDKSVEIRVVGGIKAVSNNMIFNTVLGQIIQDTPQNKPQVNKQDKPNVDDQDKPNVDEHDKPNVDEHDKPNVDGHDKPNVDEHDKPNVDDQDKPNVDEHDKPNVDEHDKPNVDEHDKPNVDDQDKPNVDEHDKPNVDEHDKPNVDEHDKPNVDEHDKPNVDEHELNWAQKKIKEYGFENHREIKVDGGDLRGTRENNVKVDVGFGPREYWAFTNEHGQLVAVIAEKIVLQDEKNEPITSKGRYYHDEAKVPGTERPDLDEGHVIADSLGGVSNAYNITPQNSQLNRHGQQAYMEKVIRQAGGAEHFVAFITYPNTQTQIPKHYHITYLLKGQEIIDSFDNKASDKKPETGGNNNNNSNLPDNSSNDIKIIELDKVREYVSIKNFGEETIDISGWTMISERGYKSFIFPEETEIHPNQVIKLVSGKNPQEGDFTFANYDIWSNSKLDPAVLKDENGKEIARLNK